jgi:NADPH2:quinone reductase
VKALRIHDYGGPEALRYEDLPEPEPKPTEVVVRVAATGVNYIDVYHRTGLYKLGPLPFVPGVEAAGEVIAVGADVRGLRAGDRVAFAGPLGAYAEAVAVPAEKTVPLPHAISFREGAAVLLQGLTAHYLALSTYALRPGDTCLVHAAAGGVGLLLCRIARRRGARVIATTSTPAKAELAREAGAEDVILYSSQDFAAEVRRLTDGRGVQVVYDGVGRATYDKSLSCLAPRGTLALFGQASGPVPPLDPQILSQRGSLFLTRPTLSHYTATREELLGRATDLFAWMAEGWLRVRIEREYALRDAASAHRVLEGRETTGKVLLIP